MAVSADIRRAWRFLVSLVREYEETGCDDSAAKLTYTTLFAVVPTLTVAWAILRALPQLGDIGTDLDGLLFNNLLPATGDQVREYIGAFAEQAANLTGVGVAFLAVTAVMMLLTIERRINAVWRLHRERSLVSSLLVYWALLTLGPVLLGAGVGASSYLLSTELWGEDVQRRTAVVMLLGAVPFLVEVIFFSLLYIVVPNCSVPIRDGVVGGVIAALLFEIAKAGFAFFVTRFNSYELVYGAFAAVPLFLLWIYISWSITLFGVVLVYTLSNHDDEVVRRGTAFPALLKVLGLFHRRQREGRAVADAEARRLARASGIGNWHDWRETLLRQRLVERLANGDLVLVRDLHAVTLADLVRLLSWGQIDRANDGGQEPDTFAQSLAKTLADAVADLDARLGDSVASVLESPLAQEIST